MECNIRNIFRGLVFMLFVLSIKSDTETEKLSFIPSHYKLEIFTEKAHFEDSTSDLEYKGVVTVTFDSSREPKGDFKIELNADKSTKVTKIELIKALADEKEVQLNGQISGDKLIITIPGTHANTKKYQVRVQFQNPFRNDMTGFYRSSYKEGGKTKWLLTTHFEPIFARKAFPCFDEPHLKATFQVSLTVPESIKTVLSNTPVIGEPKQQDGLKTYNFEETPCKMSTYLVAFTASEFHCTDGVKFENDKKELRTCGRKDVIDKKEGEFAQNVGKEAVEKLKEYLDIPYKFQKIDQIGIPDFSAGAMENWGHISFREKSLFYNKVHSSAITKQSNLLTITHELVHQWFGNLVTLHSWDYIWLNEAFATYIEYIIADKIDESKTWNLLNQLVVNEIHLRALEADGLSFSTPLNYKIPSESKIFSSFNDIPYSKGAAVLRMWHSLMGNKFETSIKQYLKDSQESTVTSEKLLNALKAQGLTEPDFKSWTDQAGYPVVQVKKMNGYYSLTQERFLWEKPNNPRQEKWRIPITYMTDSVTEPKPLAFMEKDGMNITEKCKWIIVNLGQIGYYRVNYDKENWNALTDALLKPDWSKIHELNRAQIINDVFSLARSSQHDYVEYSTALNLAMYLKNETAFVPWKTALTAFEFLQTKVYGEKFTEKFKNYVFSLILPHYKGLRPEKLDHVSTLMNIEISRWACSLDHKPCVDEALEIFKNKTFNKFPNTQETLLCTAVRHNVEAWNIVHELYRAEEDSGLRMMYISALGCTTNQTTVENLLAFTLRDPPTIRRQDLTYVLSAVYNGNFRNVEPAFKFIQEKYENIYKTYGGINPLGKALIGIARKLKTEDQLEKMKELVNKIKKRTEFSAAHESADSALSIAQSNINWVKRRMDQLNTYFNSGSLLSYSLALLSACLLFVVEF